ncbi:hypothetical protein Q4Q34_15980 [Flavivirga abyssicola]|uniref:hypothetical protein n=1 Tax=Flavivirga abyssicola TaxID=3063533 RepID=UPI0026DECE32|nr:hypothetical protein [Flavivirga sp. MEBiC07777]WVK12716.1 hypothetical protein Q4Q34_15980 [Flavivirga sp. MEBiC07777]
MIKNITVIFLISFLTFSCSSDDNDPMDNQNCNTDFPFLKEGQVMVYDASGFFLDATKITFTTKSCNGSGFLVDRTVLTATTNEEIVSTDLWKQDGDFLLTDSNNNQDYFSKIYKKGAVLGDKWTHTALAGKVVTHEVIAVDSLITVPAGTFSCTVYKYSTSTTINESFVCWNDDIGNIKEDGDGFFTLELASYQ